MLQVGTCKLKLLSTRGDPVFFWQNIQVLLVCAALSEDPDHLLRELADLVVGFIDDHKKTQEQGFSQELAFCAHFSMFLNAALRARNAAASQKKIFPEMGRKFTGLNTNQSFSLPILVFNGQIFGGCNFEALKLGHFYASHYAQRPHPDDDPELWQKLGLMIACCSEEPEEKCMQLFCDSAALRGHPDMAKLRKWQSVWVTKKGFDHFDSFKLSDALADAAERELRDSRTYSRNMAESDHRKAQQVLEYRSQHLHQQIGLEQTNPSSKQKLLEQLAGITLEWAKKELEYQNMQNRAQSAPVSSLLQSLKRLTSDFWPDSGTWGFQHMHSSLSDILELYGLFKALEVTQKIKNVGNCYGDLSLSCAGIPNLLLCLDELKLSFQQLFWPAASDAILPALSMQRGVWNEWGKQNPMRLHSIIPRLVEELLGCCRDVRQKALELLLASGPSAETPDSKKLLAGLYRRVHDTV